MFIKPSRYLWPGIMTLLLALCLITTGAASDNVGVGVELLAIEQADCPWCERFREEIEPAYPKTSEGKMAPLRWLPIRGKWPSAYQSVERPNVSPTFILVRDGKEVDRLYGYSGEDFFWFLLQQMLDKL